MCRNTSLIFDSWQCLPRRMAATTKRTDLHSSENKLKLLHYESSSIRFFKLWRKLQLILKNLLSTTNFRWFHAHLFNFFSPQLNNQTDSDSIIKNLLLHLLNQSHSLDPFQEQNKTDAETLKKKEIDVFTQTEFANSSRTEVSPNHNFGAAQRYFGNLESFAQKPATLLFSETSCWWRLISKKETLQVKYEFSDYLSSYSTNLPRKNPPALMIKFGHNPFRTYPMILEIHGISQKKQTYKRVFNQTFQKLPRKIFWFQQQICLHLLLT